MMRSVSTNFLVLIVTIAVTMIGQAQTANKKIMINKSTPILHVSVVEPSVKFWTERFGFKATIEVPEGSRLGFVALEKGGIELMYQTYSGMKADSKNPLARVIEKGPSFLFMEVTDIQETVRALQGADIVRGVHETPYGSKEVLIKEPGGHYVIFAQLPLTK